MSDQGDQDYFVEVIRRKCFLRWVLKYTTREVKGVNSLSDGLILTDVVSSLTEDFVLWRNKRQKKVPHSVKKIGQLISKKKSDPSEERVEDILAYISEKTPHYKNPQIQKEDKRSILSGGEKMWTTLVNLIDHFVIKKQLDQWNYAQMRGKLKFKYWLNYHLPDDWMMKNYTDDWRDGIRLNAFLNGISEEWCADWRDLKPENAVANIRRALDIMTSKLHGVVQILDPEDIAYPGIPEYCMITFLSQLLGARFSTGNLEILLNVQRRWAPTPSRYNNTVAQRRAEEIYLYHSQGFADQDVYDDYYGHEIYDWDELPGSQHNELRCVGRARPREASAPGSQDESDPPELPPRTVSPVPSSEDDDQVQEDQELTDMDSDMEREAVPMRSIASRTQLFEEEILRGNPDVILNARTRELPPLPVIGVTLPNENQHGHQKELANTFTGARPKEAQPKEAQTRGTRPKGEFDPQELTPKTLVPDAFPSDNDNQVQEDQTEMRWNLAHAQTKGGKAVVLFSYEAQDVDELSLEEGMVITVISKVDIGWWFGEINGRTGLFPANYVSEEKPWKHPLLPLSASSENKHDRSIFQASIDKHDEKELKPDNSFSETETYYNATTIPGAHEESEAEDNQLNPEKEMMEIDPAVLSFFRPDDVARIKKCIKPASQYNLQIAVAERYNYRGSRVLIDKVQYYEDSGGTEYFAMKSHYDSSKYRELLEEALIMIRFRRKTLMSLHSMVVMDGIPKLLVPWMRYGNLQEYLREQKGKMPWRRILKFALDVTDGMLFLSEGSIIHRYLAAKHCLVDGEFQVKISDFSKCKDLFNMNPQVYQSDEKFDERSFAWMSLETLRKGIYSQKTDLWSFGVILWEIISQGGEPYQNIADDSEMIDTLIMGELLEMPREIKTMLNSTDEEMLTGLMKKCWDLNPEKRPDWGEIKETLMETDPYKYTHFYEKAFN